MNCKNVREYLYSFVDNELDDQKKEQVQEHLFVCPLCSLEVESEKKVDSLLRNSISKVRAPFELKEAILSYIGKFEEKGSRRFAPYILKPVLTGLTVVFLMFIVYVSFNKPFPVFNEAVKSHIKYLQGNLSIDVISNKPVVISKWFQTKLDFKVTVPDLASHEVYLLGARECGLKDIRVAYIMYVKNKHDISVFIFDAKNIKFPKTKKVAINNKLFYLCKEKGYSSALLIEEGIASVFVSDLSEAELLYLASL